MSVLEAANQRRAIQSALSKGMYPTSSITGVIVVCALSAFGFRIAVITRPDSVNIMKF